MSTIVVFGAAGRGGTRIAREAAARGHTIVAVVRDPDAVNSPPPYPIQYHRGDATSDHDVTQFAAAADAVVLAVGGGIDNPAPQAARAAVRGLSAIPPSKRPRLVHLGGGGSLLTASGTRIVDEPDFPPAYRSSSLAQAEALDYYRALPVTAAITWTFVSPPPVHFEPGRRHGVYRTARDHPVLGTNGRAEITYEDLAMAMVDEIEQPRFLNTRFTVGY